MPDFEGRFLWYELKTTDPESARAFYSVVLDWAFQEASIPNLKYTLFRAGDTPVAGLMPLSDRAREAGTRPGWLGYVACPLVPGTVNQAKQFGGYEHVPPTFIPGIGRFAVVTDPQRAEFGLLTRFGQPAYEPAGQDTKGQVGWHELLAADWPSAFEFYSALFKWQKAGTVDIGEMGTYQLFASGERVLGGMFNKPPSLPRPSWLYYFNVGAIDGASKRVTAEGGRILLGPMQVPGGKWIVQCTDPQGAMFALSGEPPSG